MKINFSQPLLGLDGKQLQLAVAQSEGPPEVIPATLATAAIEALMVDLPDIKDSGTDKLRRARLADRIYSAGDAIDVSAEDVALIERRVGSGWPASVVLAVDKVLNPA